MSIMNQPAGPNQCAERRHEDLGEDYADAFAPHRIAIDQYLTNGPMWDGVRQYLNEPILDFKEHVRKLRQRNQPGSDLTTAEIVLRESETPEKIKKIDDQAVVCEELRKDFLAKYKDPAQPAEAVRAAAINFEKEMVRLQEITTGKSAEKLDMGRL